MRLSDIGLDYAYNRNYASTLLCMNVVTGRLS